MQEVCVQCRRQDRVGRGLLSGGLHIGTRAGAPAACVTGMGKPMGTGLWDGKGGGGTGPEAQPVQIYASACRVGSKYGVQRHTGAHGMLLSVFEMVLGSGTHQQLTTPGPVSGGGGGELGPNQQGSNLRGSGASRSVRIGSGAG